MVPSMHRLYGTFLSSKSRSLSRNNKVTYIARPGAARVPPHPSMQSLDKYTQAFSGVVHVPIVKKFNIQRDWLISLTNSRIILLCSFRISRHSFSWVNDWVVKTKLRELKYQYPRAEESMRVIISPEQGSQLLVRCIQQVLFFLLVWAMLSFSVSQLRNNGLDLSRAVKVCILIKVL